MTIKRYREHLADIPMPDEVRAAVEVLLAHAERSGNKVITDRVSNYLAIGSEPDYDGKSLLLLLGVN